METHSVDGDEHGGWADLTLSVEQVLRVAIRWLPGITVLSFLPYLLIWGLPDLPSWTGIWDALSSLMIWSAAGILVYAVSALVHEALHLAAMIVVARIPPSSVSFGMRLKDGVLYVHAERPMTARSYRVVLLTPAVVLGLLPAAAGTVLGIGWLLAYGYVMLASAVGDFVVLQLMRHLDGRTLVRDHPRSIGCQVLVSQTFS